VAVFLITTLLATAGIFLQLRAEFLFFAQIILYVGGIMILFLFVICSFWLDVRLLQIPFGRHAKMDRAAGRSRGWTRSRSRALGLRADFRPGTPELRIPRR